MTLNVFGKKVKVRKADLSDEDCYGMYIKKDKLIILEQKLEGEAFIHTLLHELFHAFCDRNSIRQGISSEVEEIIADSFITCLLENFNVLIKD